MGKKYVIDEETLVNIANAIRANGNIPYKMFPALMPDEISNAVNSAFSNGYQSGEESGLHAGKEQGKQEAYDAFWDAYQNYGKRTDSRYFCSYYNFTPETFKPKYPIYPSSYMFDQCRMEISLIEQGVKFNPTHNSTVSLGYAFRGSDVTEIPTIDVSNGNPLTYAFYNMPNLTKIEKLIVGEKTTFNNSFGLSENLTEIRFEGVIGTSVSFSACPLSKESILSIITHLSGTSSSQTLTLKSSAVGAIDWSNTVIDGVTYNTFDEICDLKPNWTISLV